MTSIRSNASAATLVAVLLGACAGPPKPPELIITEQAAAMRAAIAASIDDQSRRETLLQRVDDLERVLKEHNADLTSLSRDLQALNRDYDAPRAAFDALITDYRERVGARFEVVQALHFEMVAMMDAEQWRQVVALERLALEAAGSPDIEAILEVRS